jgi:hypothetical protein
LLTQIKSSKKHINKIAFICHEATMYIHYVNVWKNLEPDDFVIILVSHLSENIESNKDFRKRVAAEVGKNIVLLEIDDVRDQGILFKYVVSNNILGSILVESVNPIYIFTNFWVVCKNYIKCVYNFFIAKSPEMRKKYITRMYPGPRIPIPLAVGIKQIRFMYGPDLSDGWSLGDWNKMYDLVMCHGEADSKKIQTKFGKKTLIMGYPRYDGYFCNNISSQKVRKEFGLTENDRIIYWMPTVDAFNEDTCSIPIYADLLTTIKDYTIIVRPHPITFRTHPNLITLLENLGYLIDRESKRDTSEIFKICSAVLCDHGGSAFGAFYLRKKLIFLETPNYFKSKVFKNSTNQDLASFFPMLNKTNISKLNEVIEDETFWKNTYNKSSGFYKNTFGDYFGSSAERAASILKNLDTLI